MLLLMKFSYLVLQDARSIAGNITLVGGSLLNATDLFVTSLQGIISNLGSLSAECGLSFSSTVISLCTGVVGPVTSLATAAVDGVPDVSLHAMHHKFRIDLYSAFVLLMVLYIFTIKNNGYCN